LAAEPTAHLMFVDETGQSGHAQNPGSPGSS
jgi:hypothetical protein